MGAKPALIPFIFLNFVVATAQSIDSVLVEEFSVGSFQHAIRVAVGKEGQLYVLDADQHTVNIFSDFQKPPKIIGGFGWASGSFDRPSGVATDGIHTFIADYGNHRIQRFDRNLNFISSFSTRDTSDLQVKFGYPLDIAISDFGDLFVLDGENQRVLKFNPSFLFERVFGDINSGEGRLHDPIKISITNSRLFVCEKDRLVVFDYFGNYLGTLGNGVLTEVCGFTLLPHGVIVASHTTLWRFSESGMLEFSVPLNHLICSKKIEQIQDVAYRENRLFVLSLNSLFVFPISK